MHSWMWHNSKSPQSRGHDHSVMTTQFRACSVGGAAHMISDLRKLAHLLKLVNAALSSPFFPQGLLCCAALGFRLLQRTLLGRHLSASRLPSHMQGPLELDAEPNCGGVTPPKFFPISVNASRFQFGSLPNLQTSSVYGFGCFVHEKLLRPSLAYGHLEVLAQLLGLSPAG